MSAPRPIPPIEERMRTLIALIAIESRPCRDCGERIFMVKHENGRKNPYTSDGVNHAIHCPFSSLFRTRKISSVRSFDGRDSNA